MSDFKTGDLVKVAKLKNSPEMLVTEMHDKKAVCLWFDANLKKHTETFYSEMLKKVEIGTKTKSVLDTI